MEQSKESLRRVQIGRLELNEEIDIASSSSLAARERPEKVQPLYLNSLQAGTATLLMSCNVINAPFESNRRPVIELCRLL